MARPAGAQDPGKGVPTTPKHGGTPNIHMIAHVEVHPGASWKAADIEMEQDPSRPYVYVCGFVNFDAKIYDVRDPAHPKLVYTWTIENPELHRGIGAMDGKYFKVGNRYYYAQSLQFMQGSPDADLGAVILDVTGLPDPTTVKEVARIRYGAAPGGFHNTFAYKHSDGRVLYFATVNQPQALVYDLAKVVSGADSSTWLIGKVPNPTPFRSFGNGGYHDFYVGYDPGSHQDKFYGAGLGGYSVFDVTHPETPKQMFTITGFGMDIAHTFTPSPDGHFAVTETEYQYTPLRIWDLDRRPDRQEAQFGSGDFGLDRRLARPLAQSRGPLALRVRVGIRRRPTDLRSEGPQASQDRRSLLHVRLQARGRLRRESRQRVEDRAGRPERGAGGVRSGRAEPRRPDRHL